MSKTRNFFIGTLVGGIVGSIAALLFAPKSGKELREDISEQVQNVSEKTAEIATTITSKTQNIAKQVTGEVRSWKVKQQNTQEEAAATLEESDLT